MTKGRSRRPLLAALGIAVAVVLVVVGLRAGERASEEAGVLFFDDFLGAAGQAPDASRWGEWSGCTYNSSAYYGDIKCGNRSTLDGHGHLAIDASPGTGTSISTGGRFDFVYGEASAWIEMPKEVGYWPAFWTLNADPSGKFDGPKGEIDVMETYTTFPMIYHRGIHNWNSGDLGWSGSEDPSCGNRDLSDTFHKYTVRVEPGRIEFFFDDVPCGGAVLKDDSQGKPYQFGPDRSAGNWLILSLAIGGAGGQQEPAIEPAVMLVDRVLVRRI